MKHDNQITPSRPDGAATWRGAEDLSQAVHRLQGLIWPDRDVSTEEAPFFRLKGSAGLSSKARRITFATGGEARFGTWFNLFNVSKWVRRCGLRQLSLSLEGSGRFHLVIQQARAGRSSERIVSEIIDLDGIEPVGFDLSEALHPQGGVVFFSLRALSDGVLTAADWTTTDPLRRSPRLMVSITTFRRPQAVARSVRRFERFIAASQLDGLIRMQVVDNGQDSGLAPSAHVDVYPNPNLGGAGGFARGLIEARASGATHCLFMDDDAASHMESLEHSWMFLAHALDDRTAIAGAMIDEAHKWAIWENGAIFDQSCHPLFMGTDLREIDQVLPMEHNTALPPPDKLYGGWWFFAFPLERARHLPFPFFVRGDDVSFSLANDFDIVRLNGVASYQGNFAEKDSPLTFYLDLRSHLAHHLALPRMEVGRRALAVMCFRFAARCILRHHYDSLDAVNLAIRDAMKGPGFFAANADAAEQRAQIKALTRTEIWQDLPAMLPRDRVRIDPDHPLGLLLAKVTGSGMVIPFLGRVGNRRVLSSEQRGAIRPVWASASLTYVDTKNDKVMHLAQDRRRAIAGLWNTCKAVWALSRRYDALRDQWRQGYDATTLSQDYWNGALHLPAD
ncbi:hypothetical protein [Paracoccus spongiarum]|uniref:Galactofuranosyltransferase GlfT2 N-terminal domain-containing protein n=1 Tax=Paracoccus spongiarum TaxID=3064387 RepID=A0ABT9JDM8_9RHOB|nr:hypothetical protein [Paracoccus sp. 2205BS29-5]MDP5307820.1 hypothetical protein [Paracoccus sp. 2205BS29-5]